MTTLQQLYYIMYNSDVLNVRMIKNYTGGPRIFGLRLMKKYRRFSTCVATHRENFSRETFKQLKTAVGGTLRRRFCRNTRRNRNREI